MRPAIAARLEALLALHSRQPGWEEIEGACVIALALAYEDWCQPEVAVYFCYDGKGWVVLNFGPWAEKPRPLKDLPKSITGSLVGEAMESGQMVRAREVADPFPEVPGASRLAGECVAIPLKANGRTLGAFLAAWPEPQEGLESRFLFMQLTAWHVAALISQSELVMGLRRHAENLEEAVASRSSLLAEALGKVQDLYAQSQAQLERLKAFTEISMRINSHGELGPLLDAVAELAARLLNTSFAFTALLQADGTFRVIPDAGHWGLSEHFIEAFTTVPGCGLHHHAITSGAPVASEDILHDDRSANSFIRREGFRAEIVAPMMVGDRAIGILAAGQQMPRTWTEDEIAVLQFLSSQAAAAIDRARALDELRALDRLKDEILGIASHELRTPLTAIKGFAAILASDSNGLDADAVRKYAHIIDVEADRMIRLVGDMLDVSRIESGRVTVEIHPQSVADLVEQAIYASWGTSADRIEVEVDEGLEIMADADHVVRILTNLLDNARKYSEPGTKVAVRVRKNGDMVEVRVWNEGKPFDPGETEQLFRKFSRLDRHRASGARGAGLGLYIARQLVLAMGGRLWVESTPDGPTFAFALPAAMSRTEGLRAIVPASSPDKERVSGSSLADA